MRSLVRPPVGRFEKGANLLNMINSEEMQVPSVLQVETPEQIYARVFREIKPRTAVPGIRVEFCPFANVNSFIKLDAGLLEVRMSDMLTGAPASVLEALAYILISKLYRKAAPAVHSYRYRLFLNRRDMRDTMRRIRQLRGRKFVSGPQGEVYNLEEIFEELNLRFFGGLMARPQLGWSRKPSRTLLGHFDPSHNAIIISGIFDRPAVPPLALEYVMFHEMLHLRYPTEHRGARRCVHTREFKTAEKAFPDFAGAKELLKKL